MMKELDLHGVSHYHVEDMVENWALMNEPPFRVITGNSDKMKELVHKVLNRHKMKFYTPSHNSGEVVVLRW
jgi:hypothetical protein